MAKASCARLGRQIYFVRFRSEELRRQALARAGIGGAKRWLALVPERNPMIDCPDIFKMLRPLN